MPVKTGIRKRECDMPFALKYMGSGSRHPIVNGARVSNRDGSQTMIRVVE